MSDAQSSPDERFENKRLPIEDKVSINDELEVRCPIKFKSKRNDYKSLLNFQMYDLLTPKSAFMVFNEVFEGIKVELQKHPENLINRESYTCTIEIDGQFYAANDISMDIAREKACERCLRNFLAKKISKLSKKKKKSLTKIKMEDRENGTVPIPKCPPLKEFPWQEYAKLAMHNLINQWEIKNASKAFNVLEEWRKKVIMNELPSDPYNYSLIQLIHHMRPHVEYVCALCSNSLLLF